MTIYTFALKSITGEKLASEIIAAGLPLATFGVSVNSAQICVVVTRDLSGTEQTTLANLITAHTSTPPKKARLFYDVYQQLKGVTPMVGGATISAAQQNAIWTDITSGSPPKWTQISDAGIATGVAALHWAAANSGATAANVLDAKRRLVAAYVLLNTNYLVNPAFSPAVNIPGDQLA